jgi:hypothetical protein
MADDYDRIYGYGSEIAQALREDDAARVQLMPRNRASPRRSPSRCRALTTSMTLMIA